MVALLERADEWDALTAAVGAAGRSRGSVVLVSGEAGIGKTSLVRAFAEHVAGRARRFVGGCDDLLTARPLGPLRDAAAGSGGPLEAALRSGGDVFAAVVAELSGPRVTAVVVEDLHWADDATLDVLGYLARRIADLPAVLVLTYRDEAAATAHPVYRLLGSLVGRRVVRLPLRALSSAAVVGLAAGSGWDPQRLHALTGGNPFYVTEALAQTGPGVPVSVSDAVLARVARLDDPARAAVEQLSVVPTMVGLDLAHSLLGDRLDALAEAEARGIVSSRADGLTFRHELARQAVEQGLTPLRRRTLHRAVVAALQAERAPDLARLVHHAAAADDGATVSRYAPLAGREAAAAGSHRQALAHFSAALRHGHRLADADLARLVDEHAWELYNAGRFTEALHGGERAVRLRRRDCPDGGRGALAEALVRLSRHRFMAGDPDGADAAAAEAVALLDTPSDASSDAASDAAGSPSARAFAATYLGAIRALTGHPGTDGAAYPLLRRARELATAAGRADFVALCRNYASLARPDLDDDARVGMLADSLRTGLEQGFYEVAARAYTNLGELCFRLNRLDELEQCVADGLAFTRERGFSSHAHNLAVHGALLALRRGDWAAAEATLRPADATTEPGMPNAAGPYGRLLARRSPAIDTATDPATGTAVEALLDAAWDMALRRRTITELALAGTALAEWAWLADRPDRLADLVRAWRPHATRPTAGPAWAEVLRYARRAGLAVPTVPDDAGPWAAGLRGDWRAAADGWAQLGDPYERALELAESGAVGPTVEALHTLDDLGAVAAAHHVRCRLRTLGMTRVPRRRAATTRANPAGLTDRQLDVHALLAEGLTNAEIAQRLVLSVRTVDSHVAAILDKLGVRTRREAAARHLSR
jgi:DNA-binding CsgD family transcriptional regulator/tetratricopeptide (TPR) repeat protein